MKLHVLGHRMSPVLLNLKLEMVRAKNTRRCILPYKHVLALIIIHIFFRKKELLLLLFDNSGYLPVVLCLRS